MFKLQEGLIKVYDVRIPMVRLNLEPERNNAFKIRRKVVDRKIIQGTIRGKISNFK